MKNFFKNKIFVIIAIAVIIIVVGTFIFLNNKKSLQSEEKNINEYPSVSNNIENTFTIAPSEENSENNLYIDSQYGFSFQYPKDFTATKFSDQEGTSTILVQHQSQDNIANDSSQVSTSINQYPKNSGFQIFIALFDEPGPITKERILQDLPDLIIKNPEQRVLKNGIPALLFFSEEASLGETREIWFIYNNYLYQITATKEIDSLVAQILETWRFQE